MNTVSLDLAKQLKANGFPQETYFYITFDKFENQEKLKQYSPAYLPADKKHIPDDWYAAPTADEILDVLKDYIIVKRSNGELEISVNWCVNDDSEEGFHMDDHKIVGKNTSLAEAAGEMYLYLKKSNLL